MKTSVTRPGLIWPSLFILGAVSALAISSGTAAAAEPLCNKRGVVLKTLNKDYGERPVAFGITEAGAMVQLVMSRDGKTWTLVIHNPKGVSCLMAAGETWKARQFPEQASLRAGGAR